MDGSMDESVCEWEMYVFHTNQIGSTINSQSKVNDMWEDLLPIQFRMAILFIYLFIYYNLMAYLQKKGWKKNSHKDNL